MESIVMNQPRLSEPILERIYVHTLLDDVQDVSYLEPQKGLTKEENEANAELLRQRRNDEWTNVGVQASAWIDIPYNSEKFPTEITSSGVFGVANSDRDFVEYMMYEQALEIIQECHHNKIRISAFLEIIIDHSIRDM